MAPVAGRGTFCGVGRGTISVAATVRVEDAVTPFAQSCTMGADERVATLPHSEHPLSASTPSGTLSPLAEQRNPHRPSITVRHVVPSSLEGA